MNMAQPKSKPNYFFRYFFTTILFLLFFFIYIIIFQLSDKIENEIYFRKLEKLNNKNISDRYGDINDTYIQEKEKKNSGDSDDSNPFYYLFGFYIIFIFMSIYMIWIVGRSKIRPEYEKKIKSDLLFFLYFANNGSLIVSLIFLSAVYRASGFLPFGIGLAILCIGSFYYVSKIKISCEEILSDDENNSKMKSLFKIPCTIINIVQFTYECCRCEYYDVQTTTYYTDGTQETNYYCTSIFCLIWNIYCIILKILTTIFMIMTYYFFFFIFYIFWLVAKLIYSKFKKNEQKEGEGDVKDKNNNNKNPETNAINSKSQDINMNYLPDENVKNDKEKYNKDNSNQNGPNIGKEENKVKNEVINTKEANKGNNNLEYNIFVNNKNNNSLKTEKNKNKHEIKVNPETFDQSSNSKDIIVNQNDITNPV